ncbi:MAG: MaoC family dehydratase [Aeromicrobium sp.]|uniref:MaoC family dehydratase n=1 Tax=Aeromicrobium sp. TaxID=1871063 RepID=UPI0026201718|nr:MaoC family dehydratase [Aeromicrobium sp.]MDF1703564.1 MaoC family dehydratase [Aeromicrobium sp.]
MRVFTGPEELLAAVGEEIGVSSWLEITQERVNQFAEATGDQQWIHVDPERAADGPFGGTIAHGYLTLSLMVPFMLEVYRVENRKHAVNYGLNKVRFTSPVPVGSRLRGRLVLAEVSEVAGGLQILWAVTIEREGEERPACVAESITRLYF